MTRNFAWCFVVHERNTKAETRHPSNPRLNRRRPSVIESVLPVLSLILSSLEEGCCARAARDDGVFSVVP